MPAPRTSSQPAPTSPPQFGAEPASASESSGKAKAPAHDPKLHSQLLDAFCDGLAAAEADGGKACDAIAERNAQAFRDVQAPYARNAPPALNPDGSLANPEAGPDEAVASAKKADKKKPAAKKKSGKKKKT